MDSPKKQASKILRDKKMYQRWLAIFMCLALVVTSGTVTALKLTGQAWTGTEQVLTCTYQPHQHTPECYNEAGELVCGLSDKVLHTHDARCYDAEGNLVCGMEELEEHSHTSACYTEHRNLICGQEEHEAIPEHHHTEDCYTVVTTEEQVLTCGLEESDGEPAVEAVPGHVHTDACYAIETKSVLVSEESVAEDGTVIPAVYENQETKTLICGMAEGEGAVEGKPAVEGHHHTDACWTMQEVQHPELTCGLEESDVDVPEHHHTDECYAIEMVLTCDKPEVIAHEHTDACYDIQKDADGNEISRTLTCKLPQLVAHQHGDECFTEVALEAEGTYCGKEAHKHTGSCYMDVNGELVLTCGKEEHVHTDECFVEPAAEPMVQEYRGEDYTVTVSYDPAAFEAEVSLNVREIAEGTEEFEQCYQQSLEATGSESLSFARFFDVTFTDAEGNEVEPAQGYNVDVQIAYDQPIEIAENQSGQAVHFVEDEEGNVVTETPETAVEENAFNFSQGSFSTVGTVITDNTNVQDGRQYIIYAEVKRTTRTQRYALKNDGTATEITVSNGYATLPDGVNAEAYLWTYTHESTTNSYYNYKTGSLESMGKYLYLQDGTLLSSDESFVDIESSKLSGHGSSSYLRYSDGKFTTGSSSTIKFAQIEVTGPVAKIEISGNTQVPVDETIDLKAVTRSDTGAQINNPNGRFEWRADPAANVELTPSSDGKTCTVKGLKKGQNVTITVTFTEEGAEPITATHNVQVIESVMVDDGLAYNANGLYQQYWQANDYTNKVRYDEGSIDSGSFTAAGQDHVLAITMTPSDYQGNALGTAGPITIVEGDATKSKNNQGSAYTDLKDLYPNAQRYTGDNWNSISQEWVEVPRDQRERATYVKVGSTYYERGSSRWNDYYDSSHATFYRRKVNSDYYAYAKLDIDVEPGYYVTEITIACTASRNYHVYDCSRYKNGYAFNTQFDLSKGTNPSIVIRSDAFSHALDSSSGYIYDYFILIKTAAIPSPLFVKYDPGTIDGVSASSIVGFPSGKDWLDGYGRTTPTGSIRASSNTVDKIEKTNGDNWAPRDREYTISGISEAAKNVAKTKNYRFIGWKLEYYDDNLENYQGTLEDVPLTKPSNNSVSGLKNPNDVVNLAIHAKFVAQWEAIPSAEIVKEVKGTSTDELLTIKTYEFTVTVDGAVSPLPNTLEVTTQKYEAINGIMVPVRDKVTVAIDPETRKGSFALEMRGDGRVACGINGLPAGDYVIEETQAAGAEETTYSIEDRTLHVTGTENDLASITVTNDFDPPKGQLVKIEKYDASNEKALAGAEFTLTKVGDSTFTAELQASDDSGLVMDAVTLGNGTYILTEKVVPTGYAPIAPITFKVSDTAVVLDPIDTPDADILTTGENVTPKVYTVRVNNTVAPAKVQIFKHSSDTPLQGAEFELYRADGSVTTTVPGTTFTAVKVGDKITEFDTKGHAKLPVDLVLGETYYLVETKAPDGYNALAYPIKLTYTKGTDGFTLTATLTDGSELGLTPVAPVEGSDLWTLKVSNNPGTEMPHTGGMGTGLFTVGGGLLMVLAAGLYFWNKRRISEM